MCCEETEVTQQISEEIDKWDLPDVRSLLIPPNQAPTGDRRHNLPSSEAHAVAQSEYAIFITPSKQPCSRIKVSPLDKVNIVKGNDNQARSPLAESNHPAKLLTDLHNHHGQSPQSWWLQLPTTEVRARSTRPVAQEKSVAQALNQIGIFVRNYQMPPTAINDRARSAAHHKMAADKTVVLEQR